MRAGTLLVIAVAGIGMLLPRPAIRLRPESVGVPSGTEAVVEWFRTQILEHADVVARDDAVLVARFAGQAGRFTYRTVEAVRFAPDAVRFEHLDGPFAECEEEFALDPTEDGTTIVHRGHFRMRYGLAGWVSGVLAARPAFERHVAERMAAMSAELTTQPRPGGS